MNKFSSRKIVPEIIDDFNLQGKGLEENLHEIEWINKYLGGTSVSAQPILHYLQQRLHEPVTIVDVGCGSGDLLKYIQDVCKNRTNPTLIGVDANLSIIEFAKHQHFYKHPIQFIHADILREPQKIPKADVYVLNLFLHHFENETISEILYNIQQYNPQLIVINDLHRSRWAYYLFNLLCVLKNASSITVNDGRLSILKGFTRNEWKQLVNELPGYTFNLHWRWAFRWQLVLQKINKY